jgi:hypothetical protein
MSFALAVCTALSRLKHLLRPGKHGRVWLVWIKHYGRVCTDAVATPRPVLPHDQGPGEPADPWPPRNQRVL